MVGKKIFIFVFFGGGRADWMGFFDGDIVNCRVDG